MPKTFSENKWRSILDSFKQVVRFPSSTLVKVFGLTAVSTLVKILTGFITVKVVAVLIGPAGIALLGQLNNATVIAMAFATGGITNGVIKYSSEYNGNYLNLSKFLSTALKFTFIVSAICAAVLIIFSKYFAVAILLDAQYSYIFTILGCTIVFFAINTLLIAILNGFKEYRRFVIVSICTSLIGLLFSVVLVWQFQIEGALISAVTYQSVVLIFTLAFVRRSAWFKKKYFNKPFDKIAFKKYLSYTLMALTSAATVPVAQLFIRGKAITDLSVEQAGWWEAINRLSGMYLLIITTSFTVYFLPRLSEISDKVLMKKELHNAVMTIVPALGVGFALIYVSRYFIINILFSPEFISMEKLFFWQLLGDLFKIASYIYAFIMIAKSKTRMYVATEIIFTLILITASVLLLQKNGITGITQGYAITYVLYFVTMFLWSRTYLKTNSI